MRVVMRNKNKFDRAAFARFCRVLASISSESETQKFLEEALTKNECLDLALRWHLLEMLSQGVPQRRIAEQLGVSLCKITRGSRLMKDDASVVSSKLKQQ
jgi:TrpR family transcriptional regulator, trp operon repressor